jgi:hypothetical protein
LLAGFHSKHPFRATIAGIGRRGRITTKYFAKIMNSITPFSLIRSENCVDNEIEVDDQSKKSVEDLQELLKTI